MVVVGGAFVGADAIALLAREPIFVIWRARIVVVFTSAAGDLTSVRVFVDATGMELRV